MMVSGTKICNESTANKSTCESTKTDDVATPLIKALAVGIPSYSSPTSTTTSMTATVTTSSLGLTHPATSLDGKSSGSGDDQGITTSNGRPDLLHNEPIDQRSGLPIFDVYARPYVPLALRAVNEQPAKEIVVSETTHKIDYRAYVRTFAGSDFLNFQLTQRYQWADEVVLTAAGLTEQSYLAYLGMLLRRECEAKEKENEHYAMHQVQMEAIVLPNIGRLWALNVPGLREDSPLIEMGDTVQLRQLYVDFNSQSLDSFVAIYDTNIFWTGKEYHASVHSVSRVQEVVYLRADGLEHLNSIYPNHVPTPMVVNVVFPVQHWRLRSQFNALFSVNESFFYDQQDTLFDSSNVLESAKHTKPSSSFVSDTSSVSDPWIRTMLFPGKIHGNIQKRLRSIPHRALFDHAINYEQAHAVNSVCVAEYGNIPYLISGPPGTGKTKTLVEIAMQLLNTTSVRHLLICAPSEAAADTLALRLKQYLTSKQLLRLNSPSRIDYEVPQELLQYCFIKSDMFYLPPAKRLLAFSVVVTSCRDAAILAEAHLTNSDLCTLERNMASALHPEDEPPIPALHWGALLLDEAAQATEIDVLPAISVIRPPDYYPQTHPQPRLVMAGDEHQLGPRTASHDPIFSSSLFARLFSRPLYAEHPLSRTNMKHSSGPPVLKRSMLPMLYPPFTNLIRNYRSHPAILSVPSSLFYHDTLLPEAVNPDTPLQRSSLWQGRQWPVLYVPHIGWDEIERDNGGWYNISEAQLACSIAKHLIIADGVKQEDICIMSPFAAQVKLLRSTIRLTEDANGNGLWDVNVGPVEAFQGLEKRVVIICTTRARQRFVAQDVRKGAGLVQQRRKINVALTRAKEALFVIGNPKVLGADEWWRTWMAFCERNGLVDDKLRLWEHRGQYKEGKIGSLERGLLIREDGQREERAQALGAAVASGDVSGQGYEAWVEDLHQALDEDDCEEEDDMLDS